MVKYEIKYFKYLWRSKKDYNIKLNWFSSFILQRLNSLNLLKKLISPVYTYLNLCVSHLSICSHHNFRIFRNLKKKDHRINFFQIWIFKMWKKNIFNILLYNKNTYKKN